MKFENTSVSNLDGAIRGMRNPKESWSKSDSHYASANDIVDTFVIGNKDMELAQSLIKAGSEHRKFMRQIFVCVDITAPMYWWSEYDTYKVATVANSTSKMHRISKTPISRDRFEMGDFIIVKDQQDNAIVEFWEFQLLPFCEFLRNRYLETKDMRYWKELIRALPESWLQKRTVTLSYETLLNMCSKGQRRNHKLTEWSKDFIGWAKSLPYANELIFID